MEHPKPTHELKDLITSQTTLVEFQSVLTELINEDDKKVLGENALEKTTKATLYLCSFAPSPGTFDRDAFRDQCCIDDHNNPLPDEQVSVLLNYCINLGILSAVRNKEQRLIIKDAELQTNLRILLERYEVGNHE